MPQARPLRTAARELFVIVLGVLIALAADRWMEGVREAGDERRYLSRIAIDLEVTADEITSQMPRMELALLATEILTSPGISDLPADSIVALYVAGTNIGIQRGQLGSDVVFRELVSAGRLNVLRDPTIRADLAQFYQSWEGLVVRMTESDNASALDIAGLTGFVSYRLNGRELSPEARARIVAAARKPEGQERLRRAHGDLDHWLVRMRRLVSDAQELQAVVR